MWKLYKKIWTRGSKLGSQLYVYRNEKGEKRILNLDAWHEIFNLLNKGYIDTFDEESMKEAEEGGYVLDIQMIQRIKEEVKQDKDLTEKEKKKILRELESCSHKNN